MRNLTIGEAARQAGVGVETIRFYERRRLIEQPLKPQGSGFRVYAPEQVKRIKFIRQAQRIGFSLREIQELLSLRADPSADCSAVRSQAAAKLDEVKRKIEQLHQIGGALEALIVVCPGRGGLQACSILDTLVDPNHGSVPRIEADGALLTVPPKRKRQNGSFGAGSRKHKESTVKSVTLKIEGMHCDGCAETVKALVEREPGVKTVAVTFARSEARILYDPATISKNRLVAVVERPGYRVTNRVS